MSNQDAKKDLGKWRPTLVPMQIMKDIAQVRDYGNRKYHDPNNWKQVELERYVDALIRHLVEFVGHVLLLLGLTRRVAAFRDYSTNVRSRGVRPPG